jgi:hypothetical protein
MAANWEYPVVTPNDNIINYLQDIVDPCKAYITNKDLSLKVDLATVIPYVFYEQDFRGAYYVTI